MKQLSAANSRNAILAKKLEDSRTDYELLWCALQSATLLLPLPPSSTFLPLPLHPSDESAASTTICDAPSPRLGGSLSETFATFTVETSAPHHSAVCDMRTPVPHTPPAAPCSSPLGSDIASYAPLECLRASETFLVTSTPGATEPALIPSAASTTVCDECTPSTPPAAPCSSPLGSDIASYAPMECLRASETFLVTSTPGATEPALIPSAASTTVCGECTPSAPLTPSSTPPVLPSSPIQPCPVLSALSEQPFSVYDLGMLLPNTLSSWRWKCDGLSPGYWIRRRPPRA